MIIGVPKEIKAQENRVGLLPSAAYQLIQRGHSVLVESNAGAGSGFPDSEYAEAGAEVIATHAEVFARAELIVKVKGPLESEWPLIRPRQPPPGTPAMAQMWTQCRLDRKQSG